MTNPARSGKSAQREVESRRRNVLDLPGTIRAGALALAHTLAWGQSASPSGPYFATPQRPTFSADTSTTAPSAVELEFGATASGRYFGLPTNIKFTPDVAGGPLHRGEFSVAFDGVSGVSLAGNRVTQFGDQIGVVFLRPMYESGSFSLAVAPRAAF